MVWVALDVAESCAIQIFKSKRAAFDSGFTIQNVRYMFAVKSIRHQIWRRSRGYCELCGDFVLESSGQMHEQIHRGQGGDISLANSIFICPTCHRRAHADRNPRFTKKSLDI